MKKIKLSTLEIFNFKGISKYSFHPACQSGTLCGANGAGKTTVFDALSWLLFGKDSHGQAAFAIKPLDKEGQVVDHGAVTTVNATFLVDGEMIALSRTYFEKWTARRDGETLFDGHASEYFVNGVAVKKGVFEDQVATMVNNVQFALLSSWDGFCKTLSWKERRAILLSLWQGLTDQELLATKPEFALLAQALGNRNLADYAKSLQAQESQLHGATSTLPPRMDECHKTILHMSQLDFQKLAEERYEISQDLQRAQCQARALEQGDLPLLRRRLQALESENRQFRANQSFQDRGPQLRRDLAHAMGQKARWEATLAGAMERKAKWEQTPTVCPTCGKPLEPGENVAGQQLALEHTLEEIANIQLSLTEFTNQVVDFQFQLDHLTPPTVRDMNGFSRQKSDLETQIATLEGDTKGVELSKTIHKLEEKLVELDRQLGQETALTYARTRLAELEQQERNFLEKLQEIRELSRQYQEFLRYKVGFLEDSINAFFGRVRFKLFHQQVNGSLVECCEATVDGVPFESLNWASQVEAGLDIIAALSCHWQVAVPLMVDNAESITHLPNLDTQVIALKVHPDYGNLHWIP